MSLGPDESNEPSGKGRRFLAGIDRRSFLRLLSLATVGGISTACGRKLQEKTGVLINVPPGQSVARFPEKEELILLTDRPPQLETPLYFFRQDLTPNEAFFVRWHFEGIPTEVNAKQFRLNVDGHVDNQLSLSLEDLKKNFEPVSFAAVLQCSGNSRRYFQPMVPGGQWQNGAVGNARWTGVRLKDILQKAGLKAGAVQASFAGLDEPPLSNMPKFAKALDIEHALQDDILVAYQMNGEPLPLLNGFPLRLIVPGWYATYWVKSLNKISVLDTKFEGFWMDKSYRIPKNEFAEETPDNLAKETVPISRMNIRSLFVRPDTSDVVKAGQQFVIEGLAFDSGQGISKVEVSVDAGKTWTDATIDKSELGKFSWCRWRLPWQPRVPGKYTAMVRASNTRGEIQTDKLHWNKSGYMRNTIETAEIDVV